MNEMQIFHYENNEVRTILKDGEPWWVLADVCQVLELTNPTVVASRLDEDEKQRLDFNPKSDLGLGHNGATIINESGLYKVILRSDKPEAKKFTRWVTHEVLPAIRKTGQYLIPGMAPQLCPVKPSSAGEVAQLLRVLRATMKDNYQTPDVIAKTAENICKQFGIILPDDFAHTVLPVYHEYPFVDWVPGEDGEK